ncbi:MAG: rhomboid family intramembrane serine protease [Armatimonadetes bacterium]|nr:rhomboid family intramembrane serine protease [Armatimonadota bacterium]
MIPLRDENPPRNMPFVTYMLIAMNVAVFLWQLMVPEQQQLRYMMVPAEITTGVDRGPVETLQPMYATLFSSMFMHAGFMHIAGNMLYLWIFGDNVEDMLGHGMFLIFYFGGGIAAALAHIAVGPQSGVPVLGASGAVAAVLGAYLITHPAAKVMCIVILGFFITRIWLPAWIVLGGWIALQIFALPRSLVEGAGVAYMAHIGGFFAGMILFGLLGGKKSREAPPQRDGWFPRDYGRYDRY